MIQKRDEHDAGVPGRPKVVAFYTIGTPYEGEAEVLKDSLESFEYSYLVCGIPNLGTWQKNTQFKGVFIQEMLKEHPGQPLLYLDVDAIMQKEPVVLDNLDADIAAVHHLSKEQNGQIILGQELLSGTVFFGNTKACKDVVDQWVLINERYPEKLPNGKEAWDQRTLQMAIHQVKSCRFVELPQGYTWISELTPKRSKNVEQFIVHTRGARRFKNLINGKAGYAK